MFYELLWLVDSYLFLTSFTLSFDLTGILTKGFGPEQTLILLLLIIWNLIY